MSAKLSRILAIDTALNCCSAAIYHRAENGKRSFSYSGIEMMSGHSEKLMPLVNTLMSEDHGDSYENLTAICVTVGPGAFTGIRIGLSTARALGLALNVPVIGVRTFDVLIRQYAYEEVAASLNLQMTEEVDGKKNLILPIGLIDTVHQDLLENYKDVAVVIDTKRADFYTRIDGNDSVMTSQEIVNALAGRKITLLGDGLKRLYSELKPDEKYKEWIWRGDIYCPHPGVLASLGLKILDEYSASKLPPAEPVYLRGAEVSQSKRKNRRIAEGGFRNILAWMKRFFLATIMILFSGGHAMAQTSEAYFAGGCFWCTESDFSHTTGVSKVTSGYIGGDVENPTYDQVSGGNTGHAEAIHVVYDPSVITYEQLLKIFWRNIDPTDDGGQFYDRGTQYRTAIFYVDEGQKKLAEDSKIWAENKLGRKVFTQIVPATKFYPAEEYHQDFYKKSPQRYNSYRNSSGKDKKLEKLWGEE